MRKTLQSFILLLFACSLLGGLPSARASHLLGCDMTYTSLGNNQYRVKFRLYRDCSGITASPFTLSCRNGGCNATATVSAPLVQQGVPLAATPLCPSTPNSCANPSSLYPLYDFTNYEATVTLPPGQWTMSTSQGSRPTIANIVGSPDLYAEAYLDNRSSGTTTVANTSPQFDPQDIPIQYVCVNQRTTFGFSAIEPDGDSLVYALAAPLASCGTPVVYTSYPGANAGGVFIITRSPLCILEIPGLTGGTLFTPRLPIPVATDTTGICPIKQGVPYFGLNQSARTVTFTPNVYSPATSAADGRNKYQVVVEVTEYRRVNGVRRIVGRVRREAVLIVINCGANTTPNPVQATNQTPNSNTGTINTADTTQINVYSCNYSRVLVNFTDPDNLRTPSAHQLLTVTLPTNINTDPSYLAAGDVGTFTLSGNGTENPRGVFFFQPSPSQVGRTIRINVRVEDNACPVKGLQNRVIVIKVLRGNFASAVAAVGGSTLLGSAVICRGNSLSLQGRVIRPDSVRRLATNTTQAQVYTYQWTASAGGTGLPVVTNVQNIAVKPTVTTRYFLSIAPTLGFAQGACGDTTSILVRVVAPPVARVVTNNAYICPGGTATLQASATTTGSPVGTYTYAFRAANGLATADLTKANPTVNPTVTTRYYVTASGSAPTSCTDTASVLVRVLPGVVANFTTADSVGLNGQRTNRPPVIFTFKDASTITGLPQGAATTYKWTYERVRDIANNRVTGTETAFGTTSATPGPLQLGIAGYYRIRLTTVVSIVNGGVTTTCTPSVKERIVLVPDLQVPNVITPNGDGQNDYFKVSTVSTTTSKIEIFNRWGRKVYEQASYANNWGGDNQPAGVYYYLLTASNGAQTKGWIEVVR
ncbi:gliding motility-associated C-terminal domain-containing protein [Hymenobacter siberiensis]|uniref:gliding motility-associated C-terminal domain-containing protein n=1 Tax=Hymenobacter siberiensis TaxID=2848396 RepID=UPI001C1E7CE7|nr:gliding motility-associated C-terminal domain-containing protein [Hymenobacter siberiensis]MBU6119992.1 gliding motility-associated C-terminal domain-containing protein [Hymenobacter siberiensis]